jgi:hypothetical protein
MNNYKIRILCKKREYTSKGVKEDNLLYYNNEEFPGENYNKPNFNKLIHIDFSDKTLILHKALVLHKTITIKTNIAIEIKSLEFICKCSNEISIVDFETFIRAMHTFGFSSTEHNTIQVVRTETNKPNKTIYNYIFQSVAKETITSSRRNASKSTYNTQILYKK